MQRKIIVTCIIRYIDEYLIVKRSKNDDFLPGAWEFPGGNLNNNETILNGLKREIKEEIDIDIDLTDIKLINLYDEIRSNNIHYIELDFLYEVQDKPQNIKISNEHDDYKWVKKDSELLDNYIKSKLKTLY